ncbi:MAG: caspase family protein [Bacteroidota bacterium]
MRKFALLVLVLIPHILLAQSAENRMLQMVVESNQLRKTGSIVAADQKLLAANEIYPAISTSTIANQKLAEGDLMGANILWNAWIKSLKRHGLQNRKLSNLVINEHLHYIYAAQINANFKNHDFKTGIEVSLQYLKEIPIIKTSVYTKDIIETGLEYSFNLGNLSGINAFGDAAGQLKFEKSVFLANLYTLIVQRKYDEAIGILLETERAKPEFLGARVYSGFLFPYIYYLKGDFQNMAVRTELLNSTYGERYKEILIYKGLLFLNDKDYSKAISLFSESITYDNYLFFNKSNAAKFKLFSFRAEAYVGIKDFVRAKQDYESALVYMPGYQPAIDGLAKLEAKQETERVTDKTAPVIAVTEPSLSRGLRITASNKDVMIKGLASDPAGLKSVKINGIAVYTQENGNFWGNVPLTIGINKVTIVATDFAGNKGEQVFEIERNDAPVAVTANNEIKAIAEKPGRNFAVLIASQNYTDTTIPSLENPIQDAVKLKIALKTLYNFPDSNVITLYNPNISDFKKKFIELNEMIQPEDNLVIFYAGHGIWVEKEKKGFWLLTDAVRNDQNTWLPNKNVLEMISKLPARHTLLITDACFSGSVFKTRSLGADAPPQLKELDQKISRVAITSGNDSEVPDESVFMKYLVKALTENKDKYLTAQKMFINQIMEAVMTETKTEPRYGTLELAGHIGGDFIFSKK